MKYFKSELYYAISSNYERPPACRSTAYFVMARYYIAFHFYKNLPPLFINCISILEVLLRYQLKTNLYMEWIVYFTLIQWAQVKYDMYIHGYSIDNKW